MEVYIAYQMHYPPEHPKSPPPPAQQDPPSSGKKPHCTVQCRRANNEETQIHTGHLLFLLKGIYIFT